MQDQTKETYEDPDFVVLYIDANKYKKIEIEKATEFAKLLPPESKVLDLGCGPGHLSYVIANQNDTNGQPLNHQVIGTDFSTEMIKQASSLIQQSNMPSFQVCDMRKLGEDFSEDEFGAIFSNAAILHIDFEDIPKLLEDIRKVVVKDGLVFINLKQEQKSVKTVEEKKVVNGKEILAKRKFTYWEGNDFIEEAKNHGLELERKFEQRYPSTSGQDTVWINFYFRVRK